MSATTCQCSHEAGDSDCAVHPGCPNCGYDLSGTAITSETHRLRIALSASEECVATLEARRRHVEARTAEIIAERDYWIAQAHELGADVARLRETEQDLRATLKEAGARG